jgi:phosphatidate cytidylyltransferase
MHEVITRAITGIIFISIILYTLFYLPPAYFTALLLAILAEILIVEWPRLAKNTPHLWYLTPLYPILPFIILLIINHHPLRQQLLILLFATTWANDTGAYLAGKLFGKHKLLPSVSPKKTWEGFFGGLIACAITLMFCAHTSSFSYPQLAAVAAVLGTLATFGDLFESWLKRKAGIKDTGSLLPGHGGFLDRFDSVMFTSVPVVIYCIYF